MQPDRKTMAALLRLCNTPNLTTRQQVDILLSLARTLRPIANLEDEKQFTDMFRTLEGLILGSSFSTLRHLRV